MPLPTSATDARALLPQLHDLLRDAVASKAAVGFLPPLLAAEAQAYWQSVVAAIEAGHRVLPVARQPGTGELLGTVQLDLATRSDSLLRAEVSKLLEHSRARRQGDIAEQLYQSLGYQFVGAIPAYFINYDGQPHATAVYCKLLTDIG